MTRNERIARSLVANEIENFIRKLERGKYEWVAFFTNRQKPSKRPDKEVHLKGFVPKNIREVVQDVIKVVETRDYLWIAFRGTKGRPDCYVFTHKPYSEVFEQSGARPAKKTVSQASSEVVRQLQESNLRSLGTSYGKAGIMFSTDKHNARRIAVGRRDLNLNVFLVSIGKDYQLRRPDTRWTNHRAFLLSKVDERMIDKTVAWVKRGPTQVEVRDAARKQFQQTGDVAVETGARRR